MSDDVIKIEVDGQEIETRPGAMLIEATDSAGIYIPRFCYHKDLSVAANCRMCLVEVERAPKPMPACATPVMDGMKVFTRSEKAVAAQHATMEFLLINHPLDCPICDQGGECELQDLAMGYGGDVSQFTERKRVVRDKDIGPLVQTDMTRCIHCTRCVRFGEEIAGLRELGATGRGEHMEIGTYIEKAMNSEISGNVIDLCPVGALTNKPYRYSARAWELQQRDGVAPHDALGSNVHFHMKGRTVKRVIPAENAAINEVWLSDRDRYSYQGMTHADRLQQPRIRQDGQWRNCSWDEALDEVASRLRTIAGDSGDAIGALVSPSSTTEECYLLQRLLGELGSHNLDHRLRQLDFTDQQAEPLHPGVMDVSAMEEIDAALLIGAYPRHEQPLLNLRLRKAALKGAAVMTVDTHARDFNFNTDARALVKPSELAPFVAGVLRKLAELKGSVIPAPLDKLVVEFGQSSEAADAIAARLANAERPCIMLGATAETHPLRSCLAQMAEAMAEMVGCHAGLIASGCNAAGAWLAGAVPHRGPAGRGLDAAGANTAEMIEAPRRLMLLMGLDPELDCADAAGMKRMLSSADCVVAMSGFQSAVLEQHADILLPISVYAENEGSFVNLNGLWQSFEAVAAAPGESRPAWKILRMLGEKLDLPGFDAVSCADVTAEIKALVGQAKAGGRGTAALHSCDHSIDESALQVIAEVPMYACDDLVRHAEALQQMPQAGDDCARMHHETAADLGLTDGERIRLIVAEEQATTELRLDDSVAPGTCLLSAARRELAGLALSGAKISVSRASGDAAA